MSFADLLYPGNSERREKCIRLSQEIYDAMSNNFKSTNDLIKIMRDKLGVKMSTITFDNEKTIEANATTLTSKIKEIQDSLDEGLRSYKTKIEPHCYEKLFNDALTITEKFKYIKMGAKGFELAICVIITIRGIYQTIDLVSKSLQAIGKIWVGAMILGVLVLGADFIISAIVGAKERKQLKETEHELQLVVNDFVPASRAYTKEFNRLEFRLEEMDDK